MNPEQSAPDGRTYWNLMHSVYRVRQLSS